MEGGTLADVFSDGGGDRALVFGPAIRVPGVGPAAPGRGKGGALSGRGDQPDEGGVIAASGGGRKTGPVMPGTDHSGPDCRNAGLDFLAGQG